MHHLHHAPRRRNAVPSGDISPHHGRCRHHHDEQPPQRRRHGQGRIFGQGGLRLVLLHLIGERPRHGYELIRAIEERTGGAYVPSPGAIYPTLALLEEMGHASSETDESGRKSYRVTPEGEVEMAAQAPLMQALLVRLQPEGAPGRPPQITLAIAHLRMALRARLARGPLPEAEADAVAALLDDAAQRLEQC
ncbi:PadR family transcriptional regulator [Pseudoroseomonas globiformis]|uniref:PadR family transcriptional regulator n=1 Tax=Teichococcus globiformis TaxID=2307229 RepID=A0ABV7G4Z4_9PROT